MFILELYLIKKQPKIKGCQEFVNSDVVQLRYQEGQSYFGRNYLAKELKPPWGSVLRATSTGINYIQMFFKVNLFLEQEQISYDYVFYHTCSDKQNHQDSLVTR